MRILQLILYNVPMDAFEGEGGGPMHGRAHNEDDVDEAATWGPGQGRASSSSSSAVGGPTA